MDMIPGLGAVQYNSNMSFGSSHIVQAEIQPENESLLECCRDLEVEVGLEQVGMPRGPWQNCDLTCVFVA